MCLQVAKAVITNNIFANPLTHGDRVARVEPFGLRRGRHALVTNA